MSNRFAPGKDFHRIPGDDPRAERAARIKALRDNVTEGIEYDRNGRSRVSPSLLARLAAVEDALAGLPASSPGVAVGEKSLALSYVSSGGSGSDPVAQAPATGLSGIYNIKTVSANYVLTATDQVLWYDATSANGTVTLPSARKNKGRWYYVKKVDASANTVTLVDGSGYNVEFASSLVITAQGDCAYVIAGSVGGSPQWGLI